MEEEGGFVGGQVEKDDLKKVDDYIQLFYKIRKMLHDNGVEQLLLSFPITELSKCEEGMDNYLGFAHTSGADNVLLNDGHKISEVNEVHSVQMRLKDVTTGTFFKLEQLIPTLLHEFAHTITTPTLVFGHSKDGKGKKKWIYDSHDEQFYTNFSNILAVAEKLDIYKLPAGFNKFNKKSLKRFDAVDVGDASAIVGTTQLDLSGDIQKKEDTKSEKVFKVGVCNKRGVKKLIVLKNTPNIMEDLVNLGAQKLQINKKNLKVVTNDGKTLSSDTLLSYLKEHEVPVLSLLPNKE